MSQAEFRKAVNVALRRSGMRRDDMALPVLITACEANELAFSVRKATTRAVANAANGNLPESPANVDAMIAKLEARMKGAMDGSGLERDVCGVFVVHSFKSSLELIRNSTRLHETAVYLHDIAMNSTGAPEVENGRLGQKVQDQTGGLDRQERVVSIAPLPTPARAFAWTHLLYVAIISYAAGIVTALALASPMPAVCKALSGDQEAVNFWRTVIEANSPEVMQQRCRASRWTQDGRYACRIIIWAEPVKTDSP